MGIALRSETLAFTYQITGLYYTEDHHMNIHVQGNFRPNRSVIFLEIHCLILRMQYEAILGAKLNMNLRT